jgi:tRNA pseudouridine55 synthase
MDSILNINKPAGITSFSAVAAVKRLTGERRAGHAGTLDPDATGVLPVCLGKATRIVEFLMDAHKIYRAVIEMGISTDTYDAAGKEIKHSDFSCVTKDIFNIALESFRGKIQQVPPMHSALKYRGQPLYNLARAGITVERQSRAVTIYRLELIDWQPPLVTLEIECSKGTYIRSLANDIGERLGAGAHMKNLIRSAYGNFNIEDAVSLEQFEDSVQQGNWQRYLHPIDSVLGHLPLITVDDKGEEAIRTGNPPLLENAPDTADKYIRAYSSDKRFLAILARDKETSAWRPKKVFI